MERRELFRKQLEKDKKTRAETSAFKRSRQIYCDLSESYDIRPAAVREIWRENADGDYEEVLKEQFPVLRDFTVYPRLLVRNTVMKWLLGTSNIIEAEIWNYLVKQAVQIESPKILFQTKPRDTWVMMMNDLSHPATLNPKIIIPTANERRDVAILSMQIFKKERQHYG